MERPLIKNFLQKLSELTPKQLYVIKITTVLLIIILSVSIISYEPSQPAVTTSATADNLEIKLENILSQIKGAGEVKVLIVYKNDGTSNLAKDVEYTLESDGSTVNKSVIVMGKDKEAIIVQKNIPDVQGVIVTAQGAWDETVKQNIKKAVEAALPVMAHRIEVLVGE